MRELLAAAPGWLGPALIVVGAGAWAYLGASLLRQYMRPARHRRRTQAAPPPPPVVALVDRPGRTVLTAREPETEPHPPAAVRLPVVPGSERTEPAGPETLAAPRPHAGATEDWSPAAELAALPAQVTDEDRLMAETRATHEALRQAEDTARAGITAWWQWALDTLGVDAATRLELEAHADHVRAGDTGEINLAGLRRLLDAEEATAR